MNCELSIVVANSNYGRFLGDALHSVIKQADGIIGKRLIFGNSLVELLVCDAESTDNSLDVIKGSEDAIYWWCSEKDEGQSDAFNKGFSHATGKYLTWLNADDVMPLGCLRRIVLELTHHPYCEWFTGNFYRFTEDGKVCEIGWGPHYLPYWLQSKGQPLAVYGPSTIFTKELFERVGGMKLYQNFMMDTDLWMRFIVAGVKQRRINCFCWAFRMHEESKTAEFGDHKLSLEQRSKFERERKRAYQETGYKASAINRWVIHAWRLVDGSFMKRIWLKKTFTKKDRGVR